MTTVGRCSTSSLAPPLLLGVGEVTGPLRQLAIGEACQDLQQAHGPVRWNRQVIGRRSVGDETWFGLAQALPLSFLLGFIQASGHQTISTELPYA